MDSSKTPKEHKKRHSGVSANKKKEKNKHIQDKTAKERNPKAFRANAPSKLRDNFRRKQDINSRKHHIPVVDHHSEKPSPIVIAIVGPPRSGKTTLLTSLVKVFTRKRISSLIGPITVVGGKKKRYTFIEVNNDINSMIDVAKICDVALFLIDITSGMEMETFEFMEVCRQHGNPKFQGIINHLDLMKDNKSLKRKKKEIIRRVESELHWKPFFLRGMVRKEYILSEITELSRRLSAKRFAPKPFQDSRPFVLVDRVEDNTSEELKTSTPKCDRDVSLYGYLRGSNMMATQNVHIPGVGDCLVEDVEYLPDPCPVPDGKKRRSLLAEEKNCYAPHSGMGGMFMDAEHTYLELESHKHGRYLMDRIEEDKSNSTKDEDNESGVGSDQESETDQDISVKIRDGSKKISSISRVNAMSRESDDVQLLPSRVDEAEDEFSSSEDECSASEDEYSASENECSTSEEVEQSSGAIRRKACFDGVDGNDDDYSSDSDDCEYIMPKDISQTLSYTLESSFKKRKWDNEDERAGKWARLEGSDASTRMANVLTMLNGDAVPEDKDKSDQPMFSDDENPTKPSQEKLDNEEHSRKMFENAQNKFQIISPDELYSKMLYDCEYQEKAVLEFNGKLSIKNNNEMKAVDSDDDDDFFNVKSGKDDSESNIDLLVNTTDCVAHIKSKLGVTLVGKKDSDHDLFITGFNNTNADDLLELSQDEELFGDFEDLETGEKHSAKVEEDKEKNHDDNEEDNTKTTRELEILEKKRKKREMLEMVDLQEDKNNFDAMKEEMGKQAQLNRNMYEGMPDALRVQYEGFRPGMYVRMRIRKMPAEFITNFDPSYPLIVGGLNANEMPTFAYHSAKIKLHRWYPRILKNDDPIIVSLGWRRFQTQMTFGIRHDDLKLKFMKYAKRHMILEGIFWGPGCPEQMGLVCMQSVSDRGKDFRICATGVMMGADKTTQVRKKLKLIGHPDLKHEKIYKKTAFVTDMFHDQVEVGAFVGAKIQTQAGIRGIIKGPSGKDGRFRAMFEDTIKKSDVIILKTWVNRPVPRYCVYVRSLLLPIGSKDTWTGMKTVGQLKHELNIRNPVNVDSLYTEITQRRTYVPHPLKIPAKLQAALPFRFKPKHQREVAELDRVVVVKDPRQGKLESFVKKAKEMNLAKEKASEEAKLKKQKLHKNELKREKLFKNKNIKKKKAEACKKKQFVDNARAKRKK